MSASVSDSATASLPEIRSSLSSSVAAGAAGVTTAIAGLRLIARLGRRDPSPPTSGGSHYLFTDSPRLRPRFALPLIDSPRLRLRLALPLIDSPRLPPRPPPPPTDSPPLPRRLPP